jgi:hypothetical protein
MENNKMKNENKIELVSSSSHEEAQKEQDEKAERGKSLICDIAMMCSNDYAVIDSLMEILELFTVPHSQVNIGDLAEELQAYAFIWTKEHGDGFSRWKESVLSGEKYQTNPGKQFNENQAGDLAKQISGLLNDPSVPEPLRESLADGLNDLYNSNIDQTEVNAHQKSPEYIEKVLRGYSG